MGRTLFARKGQDNEPLIWQHLEIDREKDLGR